MQSGKETIEYVLKIFDYLGLNYLSAEELRQSKFDNPFDGMITKYVKTIFSLIIHDFNEFRVDIKPLLKQLEASNKQSQDNLEVFVVYYLYRIGCPFILQHKDELLLKRTSSRLMLLILAWLIDFMEVFENYTKKLAGDCQSLLGKKLGGALFDKPFSTQQSDSVVVVNGQSEHTEDEIISLYRKLYDFNQRNAKLLEASIKMIQKHEADAKVKGLSFEDALAFKDEDLVLKHFAECEQFLEILDYEIKNMRNREIFWSWIDSALELNAKENESDFMSYSGNDENSSEPPIRFHNSYVSTLDKLVEDVKRFSETFVKHQKEIAEFKQLWNQNMEKLKKKGGQEFEQKFKKDLPYLILELEQKYPPSDQFFADDKENARNTDVLFFEFWSQLSKALSLNEVSSNAPLIEKENSLVSIIKIREEALKNTEELLEANLKESFSLLDPEIKVIFPSND